MKFEEIAISTDIEYLELGDYITIGEGHEWYVITAIEEVVPNKPTRITIADPEGGWKAISLNISDVIYYYWPQDLAPPGWEGVA
jgi:hypothetical protein